MSPIQLLDEKTKIITKFNEQADRTKNQNPNKEPFLRKENIP